MTQLFEVVCSGENTWCDMWTNDRSLYLLRINYNLENNPDPYARITCSGRFMLHPKLKSKKQVPQNGGKNNQFYTSQKMINHLLNHFLLYICNKEIFEKNLPPSIHYSKARMQ